MNSDQIRRSLRHPEFGPNLLLTEAMDLVLHSMNPWPLETWSRHKAEGWSCQLAGWDANAEVSHGAVKIMLLVDHSPSSSELGFVFARMAKLVFDDLSSNPSDFEHGTQQVDDWFKNYHNIDLWSDDLNLGYKGFFWSDEPGENSDPADWTRPKYLLVQVRQVGIDRSFGAERVVASWNLVDSANTWDQMNMSRTDLALFSERLEAQARHYSSVVKHLNSLTFISGSAFKDEPPIPQTEW